MRGPIFRNKLQGTAEIYAVYDIRCVHAGGGVANFRFRIRGSSNEEEGEGKKKKKKRREGVNHNVR